MSLCRVVGVPETTRVVSLKLIPGGRVGVPLVLASVYVVEPSPPVASGSVRLVMAAFCVHVWSAMVLAPNDGELSWVMVMSKVTLAVSSSSSVTV